MSCCTHNAGESQSSGGNDSRQIHDSHVSLKDRSHNRRIHKQRRDEASIDCGLRQVLLSMYSHDEKGQTEERTGTADSYLPSATRFPRLPTPFVLPSRDRQHLIMTFSQKQGNHRCRAKHGARFRLGSSSAPHLSLAVRPARPPPPARRGRDRHRATGV